MAVTTCQDCNNQISDAAPACPKCGKPNPTITRTKRSVGILLGIGILFVPLLFSWFTLRKGHSTLARVVAFSWLALVLVIVGSKNDSTQKTTEAIGQNEIQQSPAQTEQIKTIDIRIEPAKLEKEQQSGYSLSLRQVNVALALIQDDLKNFAAGDEAITKQAGWLKDMTIVTASRFQEDYEKNEVAADKTYMKKRILLTAIVRSIDRSIGENYFLKLNGGSNMFISPHAQMADGYTDYLAALEKGQKIILACTGAGMLMGSATVRQCEPVDDWASQEAQRILSSFGERLKRREIIASKITLAAVAIENALPTSACSTVVGAECMAEVAQTSETMGKSLRPEMIVVAKRIGIDPAVVSIK